MRVYSDNAQMTSKRGKNKEVRYEPQSRVAWLMFIPRFNVFRALSEHTRTAKRDLFVLYFFTFFDSRRHSCVYTLIANSPRPIKTRGFHSPLYNSSYYISQQEPITRSVQLPYVPVTAFSQTDLFLDWIFRNYGTPSGAPFSRAKLFLDLSFVLKFLCEAKKL